MCASGLRDHAGLAQCPQCSAERSNPSTKKCRRTLGAVVRIQDGETQRPVGRNDGLLGVKETRTTSAGSLYVRMFARYAC